MNCLFKSKDISWSQQTIDFFSLIKLFLLFLIEAVRRFQCNPRVENVELAEKILLAAVHTKNTWTKHFLDRS